MNFGKFSLRLAAFSGVVALALQGVLMYTTWLEPNIWGAFAFFVILTLVIFAISTRALKMNVKNSMTLIFGAMFFRLFLSLIFLIGYLVISGKKDIPFAVGFMALYLLFQVFEIYHLVANLRPDLKK